MKIFRLSTLLYAGSLLALAACQPVTSRPELPTVIEHKIPTHTAQAAARLSSSQFKLPMTFAVNADWSIAEDYGDLVTVRHKPTATDLAFNLVTTAEVADPLDPEGKRVPFPEDFMSWIQGHPDFAAGAPAPVTVAGYPGVRVDVTPIWTSNTAHKKAFLRLKSTGWNLVTDPEKWRFIMLDDVEGERVLVLQISPADAFDQGTRVAQELLKTLNIAPNQASSHAKVDTSGEWYRLSRGWTLCRDC